MKKPIYLILLLMCSLNAQSQDFIFSQYFASQPYLNPSLTGFFDGSYRVVAHYRTQWTPVNSGINSYGISGDMKFGKDQQEGDYLGLGVAYYRDDVYGYVINNSPRINASFTKSFGYNVKSYLSFGTNLGMDIRQVNTSKFNTSWDIPEQPQNADLFVPNLGLGLNYQMVFPESINFFIGGSVDHLVSDKNSVFNSNQVNEKRITVYSSARLKSKEKIFILPSFLYASQEANRQINFGTSVQLLFRDYYDNRANMQLGLFARLGNETIDAIIGKLRYEKSGLQLGLSYDYNVNELNTVTGGFGALELSVGYIGLVNKLVQSKNKCPNIKNF